MFDTTRNQEGSMTQEEVRCNDGMMKMKNRITEDKAQHFVINNLTKLALYYNKYRKLKSAKYSK